MTQLTEKKNKYDTKYLIKAIVGIAIMGLVRFIPPFGDVTPAGMAVIGEFLGLIFLWTFVDMTWPTFFLIPIFAFDCKDVFPLLFQGGGSGFYGAIYASIGNWCAVFCMCNMLLCVALEKAGVIRRITMWFLTRKAAKKGPWWFTFMFMSATLAVSLFIDCLPAMFFMTALAHEIFEEVGIKKGDKFAKLFIVFIQVTIAFGFCMTPICHVHQLMWFGVYTGVTGLQANILSYMVALFPAGLVLFFICFFAMKRMIKPQEIEKLNNLDHAHIAQMRPGKMEPNEKITIIVFVFILAWWIVPGFVTALAPNAAFNGWWSSWATDATVSAIAIGVLALFKINGKPIFDLPEALSKISWQCMSMMWAVMLVAVATSQDATGIPATCNALFGAIFGNMNPFVFIALLSTLCIIVTNLLNNVAAGSILCAICIPFASQIGIHPAMILFTVCLSANLAFCLPVAWIPIGLAISDPYCQNDGVFVFKKGLVWTGICIVVLAIILYPLLLLAT